MPWREIFLVEASASVSTAEEPVAMADARYAEEKTKAEVAEIDLFSYMVLECDGPYRSM